MWYYIKHSSKERMFDIMVTDLNILKEEFLRIKRMGYVKSLREGYTGIGKTFEDLLGKKAIIQHHPFNASDMMHTCANTQKAKQLLNWRPQVSLKEGLQKMVNCEIF